jgi:uncharacterized coiled-coil DUF342 family protein
VALNQSNLKELFEPKSEAISVTLAELKESRDQFNTEVRSHLDKRNEINRHVKELILEVQKQKIVRNEANSEVRSLKKVRLEKSNILKDLRGKLRSTERSTDVDSRKRSKFPPSGKIRAKIDILERKYETGQIKKEREFMTEMKRLHKQYKESLAAEKASSSAILQKVRDAESVQDSAHKAVEAAVSSAQDAHDLMIELSDEVDRLRDKANTEHISLTKSKAMADDLHRKYIISLRCIHSMQDVLKFTGHKDSVDSDVESVEVSDLMSKLMAGDTLSTEELMMLQRG